MFHSIYKVFRVISAITSPCTVSQNHIEKNLTYTEFR